MAIIHDIAVNHLRPTQITVGMIEVHEKMKHLKELRDRPPHLKDFLANNLIPVVKGPEDKFFVTDHHHLGRAMWEAGIDGASLDVDANLSNLADSAFWQEMDRRKLVHPYDDRGHKQDFEHIPHHVKQLLDDPYRSLAARVRNAGGYDKTQRPFAEFLWADFFRPRIKAELLKDDFDKAVQQAMAYAGSAACEKLPGYIERK
jgi:hypothetical protein